MNSINYTSILQNQDLNFDCGEVDFMALSRYKNIIDDQMYFQFIIDSQNSGFFYERSLHLYGFSGNHAFHDIEFINSLLQYEYGDLMLGLTSFGQDLFGNQFCFDIDKRSIVLLNTETGEREIIAIHFDNWINVVCDRLEYYTGVVILKQWLQNKPFEYNNRLCPKIPFVMGGEFKVENLYAGVFPEFIKAYANIAKQVYNLPNGTNVKLRIDKK